VVPDLNVDHGRLVVFHKAGLETVGKGQRSDRRSREGDGFRLEANPREKEKSDREDDRARLGGLMEDSRQPAPNLKRFSLQSSDFIIEPHIETMRNRGAMRLVGCFSVCDDRVYNRGCFVSELEKRLQNG